MCEVAGASYFIDGLEEQHIENLTLRNVTMLAGVKPQAKCDYAQCFCDKLTSPCPTCCTRLA